MFGEITVYWFYLFSLLSIWFIKHFLKNSFDFETYLAMLNACFCVVYALIKGNDAVSYIPHDFGYYLYCLIYDKKTVANILDVYHKFNILSWITVGFLFFMIKIFRRSFVFSLVIAIGSILSQFAPYFTLFWTKNLGNPLFEYNASLKNYFKFDIDIFYGFLFFQGYVYLWYRVYKNNAQSIENQNFVKILFVTIGFFIIFYSILR